MRLNTSFTPERKIIAVEDGHCQPSALQAMRLFSPEARRAKKGVPVSRRLMDELHIVVLLVVFLGFCAAAWFTLRR